MKTEITDELALAFHRATSDGSIGQEDVDAIKDGLRAVLPLLVPEIDYQALIRAGFERHKYRQGTSTCIAFKHGAEWFREQVAAQSPAPAPESASAARPFSVVKSFSDSVLAMLDERIKAADQAAHPFNDYFGDQPETIAAAKAQAGELREVRTQVRILGDRALVDLMKFRPAIPAPAVGDGEREQFMAWQTRKGFSSDWGWDAWQARAAIAARHEKPVAWRYRTLAEKDWTLTQIDPGDSGEVVEPLYTERPSAVGDGQ